MGINIITYNVGTMGDGILGIWPCIMEQTPTLRSFSSVEIKDGKTIKRQVETFKKHLEIHLLIKQNISKVKSNIIDSQCCYYLCIN